MFVTMAGRQIGSVEEDEKSLRVGVVANTKYNPIFSGYSAGRPSGVEVNDGQLGAVSSLARLQAAKAGWFWDYHTRLWHVGVDFSGSSDMKTKWFRIYLKAEETRMLKKMTGGVFLLASLFCASFLLAKEPGRTYSLQSRFGISISVEADAGRYEVRYNGQSWFGPGIVSVLANKRWYRSADVKFPEAAAYDQPSGKLTLADAKRASGSDRWGEYETIDLSWEVPGSDIVLVTGFRLYREHPFLVFDQKFPKGFKSYASGKWIIPAVAFPQFLTMFDDRNDLYSWSSGGMFTHRFSYGAASSLGGTVDLLLLTDKDYSTAILSPFANYLVATQQSQPAASRDETSPNKMAISCGIEGLVEDIPAGFEHAHLLVVGQGVAKTFQVWGEALLERAGKHVPSKYDGDTLKYPVYWDDYGSYYREHGFKEEGYKSYEDIILGIADDAKKHGLRVGAYQVQDEDQLHDHEGIFEPREDLFPHGLAWLHEKLGVPLEAYYCWLAPKGSYPKEYPHYTTPSAQTPGAGLGDVYYSPEYWRYIADKVASWGGILFQHDFLSVYEGDPVMMAGVNRMDTYFKNMAKALQAKGLTMQYCMQLPRNIMESTENPIVVSVQASWDHHIPTPQQDDDPYVWKHLIFTSAFYGAVGIWPSRDNIQTMADANAFEDVLMANLLGGEIQLGHRIGECNFELVRKTYREGDELVLKADRPIMPLDRCYLEGCAVGYTTSERNGQKWFYVLSLPRSGYLGDFRTSDLGVGGQCAVYNFDTQRVTIVDASTLISLQREAKHEYFVVAPLLANGMAVVGDAEKFVTMGEKRIASVEVTGEGLQVGVISNREWNPVTVGYAGRRPLGVEVGNTRLEEMSSLDQLKAAKAGWYWDHQTNLWHVKVDFASAANMEARVFSIH